MGAAPDHLHDQYDTRYPSRGKCAAITPAYFFADPQFIESTKFYISLTH